MENEEEWVGEREGGAEVLLDKGAWQSESREWIC